MKEEPFDSPRNDALHDGLARQPMVILGVVNAERGKVGMVAMAVNMLCWLTSSARVRPDGRVDDEYTDVGLIQMPVIEIPPRKIDDAYAVRLAYGPKRPFPGAKPLGVCDKLELRAFRPQPSVLLDNREWAHSNQSPQGLLLGVARAVAGIAVDPSAGMLPSRRMWNPFPALLSLTC